MFRSAFEIAGQAIIHGALGFRASLEVTDHARTRELSSRLVPWLVEIGLADRIDPFHREILETPHGQLTTKYRTEACWRGESAALLGWSIHLFDVPDSHLPIDPGQLVDRLKLIRPEAADLLANATLRPKPEIDEFCAFCLAVRLRYQQLSTSPDVAQILGRILRKRMAELGLSDVDKAVEDATLLTTHATPPPRGLYVIRALAAEWLLESDADGGQDTIVSK